MNLQIGGSWKGQESRTLLYLGHYITFRNTYVTMYNKTLVAVLALTINTRFLYAQWISSKVDMWVGKVVLATSTLLKKKSSFKYV